MSSAANRRKERRSIPKSDRKSDDDTNNSSELEDLEASTTFERVELLKDWSSDDQDNTNRDHMIVSRHIDKQTISSGV